MACQTIFFGMSNKLWCAISIFELPFHSAIKYRYQSFVYLPFYLTIRDLKIDVTANR